MILGGVFGTGCGVHEGFWLNCVVVCSSVLVTVDELFCLTRVALDNSVGDPTTSDTFVAVLYLA